MPGGPSSPSPLRSNIARTGCRPPATSGRRPPARPRGRARSAGGSRPTAPRRCARSTRTATRGPRCGRAGPRPRSPSGALIDHPHLGRRSSPRRTVRSETEKIARELRAARMEDEGSTHSESAAEEAGLEDHVVSRRRLARRALGRRGLSVVQSSRANTNAAKSTSCASSSRRQRGGPGIEGSRPGLDLRDVLQTARQGLHQLLLLS